MEVKDTKEAIEFLEVGRYSYCGYCDDSHKKLNKVITLLQQGEKYKQMWELLEASMEGQYCITPMEVYFKKDTINQQMENIKQKYFLKEAKQDEAKDNRK